MPLTVVIGVGPGLGAALVRRFAAAGYPIAMINRSAEGLERLAGEAEAGSPARIAVVADAANREGLAQALTGLIDRFGGIDTLIYNAAGYANGTPAQLDPAALQRDFAPNVVGPLVAMQTALPAMKAAGRGTIIFTGGGAALYPRPEWASLSITKSGLRALALAAHPELAAQNIHLTTVTVQGTIGSRPHFAPATIAEAYWTLAQAPRERWVAEVPYTDAPPEV